MNQYWKQGGEYGRYGSGRRLLLMSVSIIDSRFVETRFNDSVPFIAKIVSLNDDSSTVSGRSIDNPVYAEIVVEKYLNFEAHAKISFFTGKQLSKYIKFVSRSFPKTKNENS